MSLPKISLTICWKNPTVSVSADSSQSAFTYVTVFSTRVYIFSPKLISSALFVPGLVASVCGNRFSHLRKKLKRNNGEFAVKGLIMPHLSTFIVKAELVRLVFNLNIVASLVN